MFRFKDKLISGDQNIANKLNEFFIDVGKVESNESQDRNYDNSFFKNYLKKDITSTFEFSRVSCEDIEDTLKSLKNKNSCGQDNLAISFLKKISFSIVYPLSIMINQSLRNGIFPDKLKIAKVIPIHKKGDTDKFENYRPISILPAISKIFEKVVYQQIFRYFTSKKLFADFRHGFRQGHSTETASIEYIDFITL